MDKIDAGASISDQQISDVEKKKIPIDNDRTSGKYFSRIKLLWVDRIHRSRRSQIPSPLTATIQVDPPRVINIFVDPPMMTDNF